LEIGTISPHEKTRRNASEEGCMMPCSLYKASAYLSLFFGAEGYNFTVVKSDIVVAKFVFIIDVAIWESDLTSEAFIFTLSSNRRDMIGTSSLRGSTMESIFTACMDRYMDLLNGHRPM
jgi:hypothetical protein